MVKCVLENYRNERGLSRRCWSRAGMKRVRYGSLGSDLKPWCKSCRIFSRHVSVLVSNVPIHPLYTALTEQRSIDTSQYLKPDLSCTGTYPWCTDTLWKFGTPEEISQKFAKYRYMDSMYRYINYGETHVSVHQGQVPILKETKVDQSANHSCTGTSYMMYRYIIHDVPIHLCFRSKIFKWCTDTPRWCTDTSSRRIQNLNV